MERVTEIKAREKLAVAAIRSMVIDVTNNATSGHPGMALDATPALYALYRDHLVADPEHPYWINRDRFVLSAGHCSALLYSMLHVAGYKISIEDLHSFRQVGSKTPGHPEFGMTEGVDATSGPLGQGIAQAVGMAIAEKNISATYPDGAKVMNHYTYCLCGDGCLQEGVSQEAISLAGHLRLNKLILIYDENGATLDGPTSDSFTENVKLRFMASEWNVIEVKDGDSVDAVSKAIEKAKKSICFPTLILMHTTIGIGSKHAGDHVTHGAPLGKEDGEFAKKSYGYDYPEFTIPAEVYEEMRNTFAARGKKAYAAYEDALSEYESFHPDEFKRLVDAFDRNVEKYLPERVEYSKDYKKATRITSGEYITRMVNSIPFTLGGSADVAGSTKTSVKGVAMFSAEHPEGRDMHYGIREFEMASAMNGELLHGGLVSYAAAFLIFSDYLKPAIRMSALEHLPAIYIFTHDTIALGEDGPTHQPIEQLAMLRSIPGNVVWRPADPKEVEAAYEFALMRKDGPTCLVLTRQSVPTLDNTDVDKAKFGAYKVFTPNGPAIGQVIATGSEVSLAIDSARILESRGIFVEVVSMPSMELFRKQDKEYRNSILHFPYSKRISLEMLSTFGWGEFAGHCIGIDRFGESGKGNEVMEQLGFSVDDVALKIAGALKGE